MKEIEFLLEQLKEFKDVKEGCDIRLSLKEDKIDLLIYKAEKKKTIDLTTKIDRQLFNKLLSKYLSAFTTKIFSYMINQLKYEIDISKEEAINKTKELLKTLNDIK